MFDIVSNRVTGEGRLIELPGTLGKCSVDLHRDRHIQIHTQTLTHMSQYHLPSQFHQSISEQQQYMSHGQGGNLSRSSGLMMAVGA